MTYVIWIIFYVACCRSLAWRRNQVLVFWASVNIWQEKKRRKKCKSSHKSEYFICRIHTLRRGFDFGLAIASWNWYIKFTRRRENRTKKVYRTSGFSTSCTKAHAMLHKQLKVMIYRKAIHHIRFNTLKRYFFFVRMLYVATLPRIQSHRPLTVGRKMLRFFWTFNETSL